MKKLAVAEASDPAWPVASIRTTAARIVAASAAGAAMTVNRSLTS